MRQSRNIALVGGDVNKGRYVGVMINASPYVKVFQRNGTKLTELPAITPTPPTGGVGLKFTPDGRHLFYLFGTAPYVYVYKRTGNTFTRIASPFSSAPSAYCSSVDFSGDGRYCVIAGTSPYLYFYKRSGDLYTKLTNPTTMPTQNCRSPKFSANGVYLALTTYTHPTYTCILYKRSGDTFTKLTDPTSQLSGTHYGEILSPDGQYLMMIGNTSPYYKFYKRSGDAFNILSKTIEIPDTEIKHAAFNSDSTALFVCGGSPSTPLQYYNILSDNFNLTNSFEVTTGAYAWGCAFAKGNKQVLALISSGSSTVTTKVARLLTPDPFNITRVTPDIDVGGNYNSYNAYDCITLYDP